MRSYVTSLLLTLFLAPCFARRCRRLDFVIVISSLLDILMTRLNTEADISYLKVVRLLRVLRPLRTIKRNKNMAMAVGAIIGSFMSVVNVAVLLSMIFMVFSILGLGLFGGLFKHCNDKTVANAINCTGDFTFSYDFAANPLDPFNTTEVDTTIERGESVLRQRMCVISMYSVSN